jgi:PLD-like domain
MAILIDEIFNLLTRMQTTAHFEHISPTIINHIEQARQSVVAVAWFTDAAIFGALCAVAGRGLSVELMIANDEANFRETGLDFDALRRVGGRVFAAGKNRGKTFMHNKFCIIDGQTVITGSFNWSYGARQNHENITISTEAGPLARQFLTEFQQLRSRYAPPGPTAPPDVSKVLKRLDLIKTLIALDETDDLGPHLSKLRQESLSADLQQIVNLLGRKQFADAIRQIEQFSKEHSALAIYVDAEIGALKIEIRILELQVQALESDCADIEKRLHEFSVQHTLQLGDLILRLLDYQRERAKTEAERAEANADYEQYNHDYTEIRQQTRTELTDEEARELKQKYRKAAQLCHPDVVAEALKDHAERLFTELKTASDNNDLARVSEILDALERGEPLASRSETVTEKSLLRHERKRLQDIASSLAAKLVMLQNSTEYQAICQIDDWESYFTQKRAELQAMVDMIMIDH